MNDSTTRLYLCLLLTFWLSGCATTHPGATFEPKSTDLVISAVMNNQISDDYYSFVEYTIENKSGQWRKVKVEDIRFDNRSPEILVNDKLASWIEGAELKLKQAQYNTALLLGSMAAVGGVVAASSSDPNVSSAGLVTMAGAVGASGAVSINRASSRANSGRRGQDGTVEVPKTHLLVPFQVAPKSFVRRWIVVKNPRRWNASMHTKILLDEQKQVSYKIDEMPRRMFQSVEENKTK